MRRLRVELPQSEGAEAAPPRLPGDPPMNGVTLWLETPDYWEWQDADAYWPYDGWEL